jgi:hypothetical protein
MKKLFAFFCVTALLQACSTVPKQPTSSITIYDSHGREFSSQSMSEALSSDNPTAIRPSLIIVTTKSFREEAYLSQVQIINSIDLEEHQLMVAVGNTRIEDQSGYHLTTDQAKTVLKEDPFRILIFSKDGKLLTNSNVPLDRSLILKLVGTKNS